MCEKPKFLGLRAALQAATVLPVPFINPPYINAGLINAGDIFYASEGTEHVAHPVGEARILVIEKEGSV